MPEPTGPTRTPNRPTTRAFTLIELIVVIIIVAIAAGAIVPRLVRDDGRRAEASAVAVREVLSAAATRAELTGSRVAVTFDPKAATVRVMEFRWAGSPADWDAGGTWQEDALVPAAAIQDAQFTSVRADDFAADPGAWTVEFPPGQRRPALSLVLAEKNSTRAWQIDLPSGSMRASLASGAAAASDTTVDLDASGRQEDPW